MKFFADLESEPPDDSSNIIIRHLNIKLFQKEHI